MKRIVRGLGLAAGAGVVGVLLAEVLLRALHLAPTDGLSTVSARQFDRIPGMLSPSDGFVDQRNTKLPHHVRVDSLGFRGAEIAREKPAGETRILLVGDSFIYGDFVDDSLTLPAQLEQQLAGACGAVRVINVGVPGTTITEHKHTISRALALAPDLVVLAFTENDIGDLTGEAQWEVLANNRAAKARFPFSVAYPILRKTALWNLAMQVRGRLRTEGHADAPERKVVGGARPGVAPDSALRARYERELREVEATLAGRGIPLAFMTFPAHLTLYGEWSTEQLEWVEGMVRSHGIPVVPMFGALQADGRPADALYLLPHDGHPSGAGYRVAARHLAEVLATTAPLGERCTVAPK